MFILFIMIRFTLTLHLLMLQACKTLGGFLHYIRQRLNVIHSESFPSAYHQAGLTMIYTMQWTTSSYPLLCSGEPSDKKGLSQFPLLHRANRTFWWPRDLCILPGSRSHCGDMYFRTFRLHVAIIQDNEQALPRSSSTTSFEPRMKVPRLNAHVPHTPRCRLPSRKAIERPSAKSCQSTPFYVLLLLFSTSYRESARIFCCCRREHEPAVRSKQPWPRHCHGSKSQSSPSGRVVSPRHSPPSRSHQDRQHNSGSPQTSY